MALYATDMDVETIQMDLDAIQKDVDPKIEKGIEEFGKLNKILLRATGPLCLVVQNLYEKQHGKELFDLALEERLRMFKVVYKSKVKETKFKQKIRSGCIEKFDLLMIIPFIQHIAEHNIVVHKFLLFAMKQLNQIRNSCYHPSRKQIYDGVPEETWSRLLWSSKACGFTYTLYQWPILQCDYNFGELNINHRLVLHEQPICENNVEFFAGELKTDRDCVVNEQPILEVYDEDWECIWKEIHRFRNARTTRAKKNRLNIYDAMDHIWNDYDQKLKNYSDVFSNTHVPCYVSIDGNHVPKNYDRNRLLDEAYYHFIEGSMWSAINERRPGLAIRRLSYGNDDNVLLDN